MVFEVSLDGVFFREVSGKDSAFLESPTGSMHHGLKVHSGE